MVFVAPTPETVDVLRETLRGDPFAADFTYGLAVHLYTLNRHAEANATFAAFARLAPHSPLGAKVSNALKGG
jgi:hypothetical protein